MKTPNGIPPQLAVVTGAVLFVQNPVKITSRMMRASYGIIIAERFNCHTHQEAKITRKNGKELVEVFFPFVEKNEEVDVDQIFEQHVEPAEQDAKSMPLQIVKSSKFNEVVYEDDPDLEILGSIKVPVLPGEQKQRYSCYFMFGKTSLEVRLQNNADSNISKSVEIQLGAAKD